MQSNDIVAETFNQLGLYFEIAMFGLLGVGVLLIALGLYERWENERNNRRRW